MSLLVGYGKACITPEESVPLAGMGNTSKRMSTMILDDLYATCIAFTDEADQTVLMFTLDQLHANKKWTDPLRQAVKEATGVPASHVMQVVKITRENTQDIILINWQAHATFNNGYTRYDISADFVGAMRSRMEQLTGAKFAFFQGASGNLAGRSRIPGEERAHEYDEYDYALAEYAMQALNNLQPVDEGPVQLLSDEFVVEVDHSDDHLLDKAKEVIKLWYETYDTTASRLLAEKYGMTNYLHAGGINTRASLPQSVDFHIDAFRAGQLAFICAPYEMFGINGMFIKEHSPFPMTFIATSCNCLHGYLAADSAFEYQCYERDYRRYPRGTAERVADAFVAAKTP